MPTVGLGFGAAPVGEGLVRHVDLQGFRLNGRTRISQTAQMRRHVFLLVTVFSISLWKWPRRLYHSAVRRCVPSGAPSKTFRPPSHLSGTGHDRETEENKKMQRRGTRHTKELQMEEWISTTSFAR